MFNLSELKNKILNNYKLTKNDALNLIDVELEELCYYANEIREKFCGNKFDACTIINIKNGRCSEDCSFCAQSKHYKHNIKTYPLINKEDLKEKTLTIFNEGFKRISYVASGKKISENELNIISNIIKNLKEEHEDIKLCTSLGLLDEDKILILEKSGVDRIHNNLESSRNYFKEICTTHSYDEKLDTLQLVINSNIMMCSGGIFGMCESFEDRIDLALLLRDLGIKSIPINILNPIKGTPFEDNKILSNDEVSRIIAIFRFINPNSFIRMAGGRTLLEDNGKKAFQSGANAAILGNMLTTKGIDIKEDLEMLHDLGYKIVY
jgi:biotin synthase